MVVDGFGWLGVALLTLRCLNESKWLRPTGPLRLRFPTAGCTWDLVLAGIEAFATSLCVSQSSLESMFGDSGLDSPASSLYVNVLRVERTGRRSVLGRWSASDPESSS